MTTERDVEEAFHAAQAVADAGHDASEQWEYYHALKDELIPGDQPTPRERELITDARTLAKHA